MAKALRSPLLGYNHNVRYHGRIFHIQTEDSGPGNPHLFTHLFYEGTILASKKRDYEGEAPEDLVRSFMQAQHKALMKELKQALHDDKIAAFFAARGEAAILDEPETAAPAVGPGASDTRALDLDAIPTPPPAVDGTPMPAQDASTVPMTMGAVAGQMPLGDTVPEAVPVPVDVPRSAGRRRGLATPGPGVYVVKGGSRELPFTGRPATGRPPTVPPPAPGSSGATAGRRPTGPHAIPPAYVSQQVTGQGSDPAGPPRRTVVNSPSAPVVVLQPPRPRHTEPTRPSTGVVVQRQVVVGVGGSPPAPQPARPTRTIRPMPFVVAGGMNPRDPRRAPTVAPPPSRPPTQALEPSPENPFGNDLISDKSLDDVILAYLSEDEGGKKK